MTPRENTLGADSATAIDRAAIDAEIAKLTGDIMQKPAAVSAIKINGRRAHELVREGQEVDIPARPVTVDKFVVLAERREGDYIDLDVTVDCSSGTYIRSLARDLGEALQVGGHLTALRRTKVGPFALADALSLDALAESPRLSLSLDEALARCFPVLSVSEEEAAALAMGKWLEPRGLKGVHAAVAPNGQAVALIKEKGKRLATVFVARPSTL